MTCLLGVAAGAASGCGGDSDPPAAPDAAVDATPAPPDAVAPSCPECTWQQSDRLVGADVRRADRFGDGVAVDGNVLVVAAKNHDLSDLDEGAAFVFERTSAGWDEVAKLIAPTPSRDDEFGRSVALSGTTIAVGAWQDDEAGAEAGAVYVFDRGDGAWDQVTKLVADDAAPGALFGNAVALAGDTLAVGAFHDSAELGAVYVFERANGQWSQSAKLVPAGVSGESHIGETVAMRADTLVVGAPLVDGGGAVYVFERAGAGWSPAGPLTRPSELAAADLFGVDVSVGQVGIAVGVQRVEVVPGVAYVFEPSGAGWGAGQALTWPDAVHEDRFGESVVAGDDFVAAGAHRSDQGSQSNAGGAHVFERSGSWVLSESFSANRPVANEAFGFDMASSGDTLVVGAVLDVAYIFDRNTALGASASLKR
ncbi:FG-GAP repeat protein [Haliangium sp.]